MNYGKVYDVRWVRETPPQTRDLLVFIDDTGSKVPLHPGMTWIQLVRLDASVQID